MINPNSGRRTDGKVKGDLFDGIMAQQRQSESHPYPSQIYDYDETVVEFLKALSDIWCLPEAAFPHKRESGKYLNWCSQLESIRTLFSSDARMRLAMKRAYDNFVKSENKPLIFEPRSLRPLLVSAIAELRREEKSKLDSFPKPEKLASKENIRKAVKDLKNIFRDEEE